ncbi:MAG: DinB family protein [Ferruginibacter sp.]|nr:DinB family protein [Ferruginibacter sp.]
MPKPLATDYPAYFENYVAQVPEDDLLTAFKNQLPVIEKFLRSITEEKSLFAYDTGKWTIRELLQHIIDTERIFNYRALCFSRKEMASLPGFDENNYAANSNGNARQWNDLVDEFIALRKSTEMLYKSFTAEMLERQGTANNKPATVKSMGFITIGHVYHHKKIMEERYLNV